MYTHNKKKLIRQIDSSRINPKSLSIRAGSTIREEGGIVVNVKKIYPHPDFNSSTYDYDVAILEFNVPINYGWGIQPIDLPEDNEAVKVGVYANITGWGDTKENGEPSKQLKLAQVPIMSNEKCKFFYSW